MSKYTEMRQRQQEEFNALPLGFAFSEKQFNQMMDGWGLDPDKDLDKIYRIPGGGYVQKKDAPLLHKTMDRHDAERRAAVEEDKTGEDFVYQMFLAEMENHEYGYTCDPEETLDALGFTMEQVTASELLYKGFMKAHNEIMGEA